MNQLALPFEWPAAERAEDFIVGPSNEAAVRHLDHVGLWPVMATLLTGPRKSGRSMLGRIFVSRHDGMLIDDAERVDEELIFHAWNRAQAERRPLLIIADQPPPAWVIGLPDLASRLAATPRIAIGDPDDALLRALIERQMAARGLPPAPDVIAWIAGRIERSYVMALRVVDLLDAAAWEGRRVMNIGFARNVLARAGVIDDS